MNAIRPLLASAVMALMSCSAWAETPTITLPSDKWSVESDNRTDIDQWERQKEEAAWLVDYADKLLDDAPAMLGIKNNGGGPALLAFSKDLNKTSDDLDKLGSPRTGPFSSCAGVGAYLSLVWQTAISSRPSQANVQEAARHYFESRKECVEQINTRPELEYTLRGPESEAEKSPKGCLYTWDVTESEGPAMGTWTCPASVFK